MDSSNFENIPPVIFNPRKINEPQSLCHNGTSQQTIPVLKAWVLILAPEAPWYEKCRVEQTYFGQTAPESSFVRSSPL